MKNDPVLIIDVRCLDAVNVKGHTREIVMIPFDGKARGSLFAGIVAGTGYDTQKITPDGKCLLSARYILEGTDNTGARCRIFIENETRADGIIRPMIVTDSEALAFLETAELRSEVIPTDGGVTIQICTDEKKGA